MAETIRASRLMVSSCCCFSSKTVDFCPLDGRCIFLKGKEQKAIQDHGGVALYKLPLLCALPVIGFHDASFKIVNHSLRYQNISLFALIFCFLCLRRGRRTSRNSKV